MTLLVLLYFVIGIGIALFIERDRYIEEQDGWFLSFSIADVIMTILLWPGWVYIIVRFYPFTARQKNKDN